MFFRKILFVGVLCFLGLATLSYASALSTGVSVFRTEQQLAIMLDESNTSVWFGGDDRYVRNVGVGQSLLLENNAFIESVGFKIDRDFNNVDEQELTLVLNARNSEGAILKTVEKIIPPNLCCEWVVFDLNLSVKAHNEYIFTCYLKNGEILELDAGIQGNTNDLLPNSKGFTGEILGVAENIEDWSHWEQHPWDFCFQVSGYYTGDPNAGLADSPWPCFGQNEKRTGQSEFTGSRTNTLKWRRNVVTNSSPAIGSDGTIYIGSNSGYLVALNPDGTSKWDFRTEDSIYSSPAIGNDGTIYVGSWDYYLYALNPDGTLKWRFQTGGRIYSSPAIGSDGTIYVWSYDHRLYALNPDGTLKWRFGTGGRIYSSPAIGSDGTIYVGSDDDYLFALNPDGTLKWRFESEGGGSDSSPAIGSDGTIYVGYYNYLYALNPDGTLKWRFGTGDHIHSSPAISSDGTIYVGSHSGYSGYSGYLYALNPDGTLKWRFRTGRYTESSPAIGSDGTIYVGSHSGYSGYLYALNPNGTQKWQFGTRGYIYSSPAIGSDGTIYIGTSSSIDAIGIPENKGVLFGTIVDYGSMNFLSDVEISVAGETTQTDASTGQYSIAMAPGTYDITFKHDNYQTVVKRDVIITEGETIELNVTMCKKGVFSGVIVDSASGNGISGVTVTVAGVTALSGYGQYSIALDQGTYYITFEYAGYQSITIEDVVLIQEKVTELNVTMTPSGGLLNLLTTTLSPAEIGREYNFQVCWSGGFYPYVWNIAYGSLPDGLVLSADRGIISGTPEAAGVFTFAIGVTDSKGAYAEREFSLEVTSVLNITIGTALARGTRDIDYTASFAATGGTQPYTFSKSGGTLPWGLSLSAAGLLSGSPDSSGSYSFTIKVRDDSGREAEKSFTMVVDEPLTITTSRLNNGITGSFYSDDFAAGGGFGNYSWRIYRGSLPTGLSLDRATGRISGTPVPATTLSLIIAVADEAGRAAYRDFQIKVCDPLRIMTATLPTALKDSPFSEAIITSGGFRNFRFSYDGQLPSGMSLDSSSGIISGTALQAGYTNVAITVTDSTFPQVQTVTSNLGIRVSSFLTITTSAVLPETLVNSTISPIVLGAGGGPSPYLWKLVSGTMPEGISLDQANGELSGTPFESGDFIFSIEVTDANGSTAEKEFIWHVVSTMRITSGTVMDGAKGETYNFILEAEGGKQPYIWSLVSGTLPSGLSFNAATGTITGTPTTRQTYSFTVGVRDSYSPAQSRTKSFSIDILDELFIQTRIIPNGRIEQAYTADITARLGDLPYVWRLESGVLPPGLNLSATSGIATLQGTPTTPGDYTFTVEVSDNGTPVKKSTREFTITIYGNLRFSTTALTSAIKGEEYSKSITVAGGKQPYAWRITSGNLPAGLTLNSTTGHIRGISNLIAGESSEFIVAVTDSGNPSSTITKQYVIYVTDPLTITTESIQNSLINLPYTVDFAGAGGVSPYIWEIASGRLPIGLELDRISGVLTETPREAGDFSFSLKLSDSAPRPATTIKTFALNVLGNGISVTPTALHFVTTEGVAGNSLELTVHNSGDIDLKLSSISIAGTDAASFSLGGNPCNGQTLATGEDCTMTVNFSATILGSYEAVLSINSDAPDTYVLVDLTGVVQPFTENYDTVFICGAYNCNCSGKSPCFDNIDEGYAVVSDKGAIKLGADFYLGGLIFANPVVVTLSGGWDSEYRSNSGTFSTIGGALTVTQGTVVVEGLILGGTTALTRIDPADWSEPLITPERER